MPSVTSHPFGAGALTGNATLNAAQDFLIYELTNSASSDRLLAYAGLPTPTSGFNRTGIDHYQLHDDFVLQSAVPFVRGVSGGNVSVPGNGVAYIDWDGTQGPNFGGWRIAISGQGSSQSSAVGVLIGRLFDTSNADTAAVSGTVRGSSRQAGSSQIFTYDAFFSTERAATPGPAFFGSDSPDNFNLIANTSANERVGNTVTSFQPNVIATRSSGTTSGQSNVALLGYVSGPVQTLDAGDAVLETFLVREDSDCCSSPNPTFPGDFRLETDAATGTLESDGIDMLDLEDDLGEDLEIEVGGSGTGRRIYIDNQTFAAIETSSTNFFHLPNLSGAVTARAYLMTGNMLSHSGFLPAGVELCDCEFITWGFWGGDFEDSSGDHARVHLGTWVAGADVCNGCGLPTSGSATFEGHMLGSVLNNGNLYLAAGNYQQVVNFSPGSAYTFDVTITNFDGQNFASTGNAVFGGQHAAEIVGGGRTLRIRNSFYQGGGGGDSTAEIGGSFMIRGVNYDAAGHIAAGKVTS